MSARHCRRHSRRRDGGASQRPASMTASSSLRSRPGVRFIAASSAGSPLPFASAALTEHKGHKGHKEEIALVPLSPPCPLYGFAASKHLYDLTETLYASLGRTRHAASDTGLRFL